MEIKEKKKKAYAKTLTESPTASVAAETVTSGTLVGSSLKVGSKVQLPSGGPTMTLISLIGSEAMVAWFTADKLLQTAKLAVESLIAG